MGCGKSKQSVAVDDKALSKGKSMNAAAKNRKEIHLERFPFEKENVDEIAEGMVREEDSENLYTERRVEVGNVDAIALPCPEDVMEMPMSPREEGTGHEGREQKEEKEEGKEDGGMEDDSKGASLEEDDEVTSLEDGHGDGDDESGRLISRDSPDHYFSSRKEDEALEGILSEYNSPVHVEANKPIPGMPTGEECHEANEGAAAAAVVAESISAVDGGQMNPAPRT